MEPVRAVVADIVSLRIQGATNIALAVLDTLASILKQYPDTPRPELRNAASQLAYARPTEPLAQNAVRYIFDDPEADISKGIAEYRALIESAASSIPFKGQHLLEDGGSYLTLCHSSTTIRLLTEARARGAMFSMYVAETRPRFQGRTTATELLDAGFDDVTMIIDDVAVSLIEGRKGTIDAVFVGADLLCETGFVNKVGTLPVSAAAARKHIPVYTVTTLLKFDPRPFHRSLIETRSSEEIWRDAPEGLQFYAPAFDYTPYYDNIQLVCEAGIIQGSAVRSSVADMYPYVLKNMIV